MSYLYDADGKRLLSRDASGTTLYLGDSEIQLAKGTTSTSGTRYYTWAGQTIAVRTSDGRLQWTLDDAHNTATAQIDATTQAVEERRTDPFGNDRGQSPEAWSGDQGFVGGVQDDTTGLTHLGARDYDPTTGRFISLDPVLELTDPQQINGYSYAANNPVTGADPSGLQSAPAGAGSSYCGGDPTCSGQWADSYAATDKISTPTTHHHHCSRWDLSCKAKSAAHHVAKVVKEHPVIAVVVATAVVAVAVACVAATAGACGAVLVAGAEGFTAGAEIGGLSAAVVSGAASTIAAGGVTIAAEVATASAAAAVVAEATTTASKEEAAASAGADTAAAAAKDTADSGSTGNRASAASPKSGTATAQGSRGNKGKFKPTLNLFKSSGSGDVGDQVSEANEYRDRVGTAATGAAKYRTYTAGIHIPTGDIAVSCSGGGNCAEVNIVEMTGWNSADILFTRAMALTDIGDGSGKVWQEMPICLTCQRIFKLGNFVPGVLLDR